MTHGLPGGSKVVFRLLPDGRFAVTASNGPLRTKVTMSRSAAEKKIAELRAKHWTEKRR